MVKMMKLLIFIYHFLISNILPVLTIFLIVDGALRYVALAAWAIFWLIGYLYLDKLILFILGAREIIDQDSQELFQHLKNESYKNFSSFPKIYLYPGNSLKCFVLESRNEWSIVLDRKLKDKVSAEQERDLARFLMSFHRKGVAWRLTKSYGLCALILSLNHILWTKIFWMQEGSRTYKVSNFVALALLKPFFEAALLPGKLSLKVEANPSLESIINLGINLTSGLSYNEFLFFGLKEGGSTRDLLVRRLEQYPALDRAEIKSEF